MRWGFFLDRFLNASKMIWNEWFQTCAELRRFLEMTFGKNYIQIKPAFSYQKHSP